MFFCLQSNRKKSLTFDLETLKERRETCILKDIPVSTEHLDDNASMDQNRTTYILEVTHKGVCIQTHDVNRLKRKQGFYSRKCDDVWTKYKI